MLTKMRQSLDNCSGRFERLHYWCSAHSARAWIVCWIAVLIAGLYPFRTVRHNGAEWIRQGGLRFRPNSIAIGSGSAADFLGRGRMADGFTIELVIRPHSQEVRLQTILAEDSSSDDPRFAIEQFGNLLLLRALYGSPQSAYRKLGVKALSGGQKVHIAVTSRSDATVLFVDGEETERVGLPIARDGLNGRLLLGNSGLLTTPWSGDFLMFGVFHHVRNRDEIRQDASAWLSASSKVSTADVLFDFHETNAPATHDRVGGQLSFAIDNHFHVMHPRLLRWDLSSNASGVSDVAVNVVGFVPFGLFGVLFFEKWRPPASAAVRVILLGAFVSLGIEILQSQLPLRSSSSTDCVMNVIGTGIGIAAALAARLAATRPN